jgi:hypothetical protein
MRKIKILKAIVDFIWWTSFIGGTVILFILIGVIIGIIPVSPNFTINNIDTENLTIFQQSILIILNLVNLLIVYCIYLFRQIIHSFNSLKIFDSLIIKNFNKIGFSLITVGIAYILNNFLTPLFNDAIHVKLEFGVGIGCISLGLFSIILSEIFTIAKTAKQENDLTI